MECYTRDRGLLEPVLRVYNSLEPGTPRSWGPGRSQDKEREAAAQKDHRCEAISPFPACYQEDTATPSSHGPHSRLFSPRWRGSCLKLGTGAPPNPFHRQVPSLATCTLSYGFKERR